MPQASKIVARFAAMVAVALIGLMVDISAAYAQSNSCARLASTLAALERDGNFRDVEGNSGEAKQLQRDLQRTESSYVRQGCNDDAKAGRRLNAECRALARKINQGRKELENLSSSVDTGNAVAQQREAILQEMARFDCDSRSNARVVREDRGNLFEQLFDALNQEFDGEGGIRGEEFDPFGDYHTVRTLCVRKTDGFYWPISYSTLTDYVPNDAEVCKAMCPGLDVDLYYYDNPGQEPEQMINTFGEPYTALPAAFRFRTEIDKTSSCKVAVGYGAITLADIGDGSKRAMVNFGELVFPLPVRDPRGQASNIIEAPLQVAEFVSVPLPRRRPAAPGEQPVAVIAPAAADQAMRIVQFGDRRVRIVGPETPYVPGVAAGT